ncbi:hypothetical protein GCM10025862_34220 [Arsenicicoccus piscis]|uniref:Uncharacterized protein n=1 Tax=Arsenicicoccus piscis TaxID=673954 RepID=A0ABQ6HSE3_9MICO|nr:hypothetical protein GCM10025862_34220 [Arsenicicoccus piscis]
MGSESAVGGERGVDRVVERARERTEHADLGHLLGPGLSSLRVRAGLLHRVKGLLREAGDPVLRRAQRPSVRAARAFAVR